MADYKILLIFLLFSSLVFCLTKPKFQICFSYCWDYSHNGDDWTMGVCSTGQSQSPINIKKSELIHGTKHIQVNYFYDDPIKNVKFDASEHYIIVFL